MGRHGSGKSVLGDIAKNTLFRMDGNATINSSDPDRAAKSLGSGNNIHNISVRAVEEDEHMADVVEEVIGKQDIVVIVKNEKFIEWFRTTQEEE